MYKSHSETKTDSHIIVVDRVDNVITATIQDRRLPISARGTAKLNPSDHFDLATGEGIAYGRAFQKFGRKLERYWEALSETESQYRGRMKAERKDAQLFAYFSTLVKVLPKLDTKKPRIKVVQQPIEGLEEVILPLGVSEPVSIKEPTVTKKAGHI